jgi:hypothetical protein
MKTCTLDCTRFVWVFQATRSTSTRIHTCHEDDVINFSFYSVSPKQTSLGARETTDFLRWMMMKNHYLLWCILVRHHWLEGDDTIHVINIRVTKMDISCSTRNDRLLRWMMMKNHYHLLWCILVRHHWLGVDDTIRRGLE